MPVFAPVVLDGPGRREAAAYSTGSLAMFTAIRHAPVDCRWIVGRDTDPPVGSVIVFIAAPFREMGSANFAVSFYTGWPLSLDSQARQLGDIRRDPTRLSRVYAGRFLTVRWW